MKRSGYIPRRTPLRSRRRAVADTLADYRAENPRCELVAMLTHLDPPGWSEFRRVWSQARIHGVPAWDVLDPHHVYGKQFRNPDVPWNLVTACRPAHEFVQGTRVGRLVCVLVKEAKVPSEFPRQVIFGAIGRDPVGLICNDLEDGIFTGRCEAAARDFCRRHGL
jgi:hypothetical protein